MTALIVSGAWVLIGLIAARMCGLNQLEADE